MGYLGEKIAEARREKGVSIEEASAATKIKSEYLQALETEDFDRLPPRAYVKGFLKIYAGYLSLDYNLLLGFLDESYRDSEPEVVFAETEKTKTVPFIPGVKLPVVLGVLGSILLIALLVVGIIKLLEGWGAGPPEEAFEVSYDPYARETLEMIALPALPASETEAPSELKLTARTDREIWLEVRADGALVFFGKLKPGNPATWKAAEEYQIKVPEQPTDLVLLLNGERLPFPETIPEDRRLRINRRGFSVD